MLHKADSLKWRQKISTWLAYLLRIADGELHEILNFLLVFLCPIWNEKVKAKCESKHALMIQPGWL